MQTKTRLPTIAQIHHVRQLLSTRLFGMAIIARWTGVPLKDVFHVAQTLPHETDPPLPNPKKEFAELIRRFLQHH